MFFEAHDRVAGNWQASLLAHKNIATDVTLKLNCSCTLGGQQDLLTLSFAMTAAVPMTTSHGCTMLQLPYILVQRPHIVFRFWSRKVGPLHGLFGTRCFLLHLFWKVKQRLVQPSRFHFTSALLYWLLLAVPHKVILCALRLVWYLGGLKSLGNSHAQSVYSSFELGSQRRFFQPFRQHLLVDVCWYSNTVHYTSTYDI